MAKQTVLLVDADVKSARVLEVSLRKAGYSVTHVKSANEAVEAIEMSTPDLVLSDTRLAPPPANTPANAQPLTDGYQLCRRLKDDPVWYSIPFIFLTSSSSIEDKIRGLELGVEDYLTKPIYIKEILTRIQLVLAKKQREGMEGRTNRASFTGLLSEMGLVDLLSTIDLGRKSGVLDLEGPTGKSTLFFRDGHVVDARCGRYTGAAAVYRVLVWNEGRFEIRFGPCAAEDVVDMSTQGLLMEGMRRLDEWQRLQEQLPPLDAIYEVDTKELASRLGEIPDEVNQILRAFNGARSLLQVVDESGFDDLGALATLSKLYFEGLIYQRTAESAANAGGDDDHDHDLGSALLPAAGEEAGADKILTGEHRGEEAVLTPSTPRVAGSANDAANRGTQDASPAGVILPAAGAAAATNMTVATPPVQESRGERDQQSSTARASVGEREEREVAKHRGKRKRSKREVADDAVAHSKSPAVAVSAHGAPAVAARDDEDDEQETGAAQLVAAPEPKPEARVEVAPEKSDDKKDDRGKPEARERTDTNNVIKFPRSPANAATESARESGEDAEGSKTQTLGTVSESDLAPARKEPAAEKRADESAEAKAVEAKPEARKVEAKKPDAEPDAKPESKKPEARPAESAAPPATQAASSRREDEKKDEKKSARSEGEGESRKGAPENRKKTTSNSDLKRLSDIEDSEPRKSGVEKRERKISFSGELGDDAKAFFQDKSYEATYKTTHDTFEDLKPEDTHAEKHHRRGMTITAGLFGLIVAVVIGLATHRHFFAVAEVNLPPVTAASAVGARTPRPPVQPVPEQAANPAPAAPENHGDSNAAAAPVPEPAAAAPAPAAAPAAPENPAAAAAPAPGENPAPTAAAQPEAPAAPVAPAPAAAPEPVAAAAAPAAPAVDPNAAAPAAAGTDLATLLQTAQRSRGRGPATAATAYQAYVDAGGNDASAIAQFAYWLAERGDFRRAAEWAGRATTLDPNNQQGWFVLGTARKYGPSPDRAAAREAFRHCTSLSGRYSTDCRTEM